MKRATICIVTIVLLLTLMMPVSLSDGIDLSSYGWDELIALSKKINIEIMTRPEFKEVKVPVGLYKVGEDIPAGKWTITASYGMCEVYWGKSTDEYGIEIPYSSRISKLDDWGSKSSVTWDLKEGTYILVNRNPVKFTPAVAIKLGF